MGEYHKYIFFALPFAQIAKAKLHYSVFIRDARYWIFADIRYADIFQLILADTDIFPFVWKHHQVSPVQKL